MQRVAIDTAVLVTALRSRTGASNAVLGLIANRRLVPLATVPSFLEYEDVLKRPEQCLATGWSSDQIDRLLAELAALIEPVSVHYRWRPQLPDPKDEMVLEAAVNGRADALVTYNERDFVRAARRFALTVIRPPDLLKQVMP